MKPHEETWVEEAGNVYVTVDTSAALAFPDKARAKLAAQAPAMARKLLECMSYLMAEGWPAEEFDVLRDARVIP